MKKIIRYAALVTMLGALFAMPARIHAQTMCEAGAALAPAQAAASALSSSDASSQEGQAGGPAGFFGAMGSSVVGALGGDTAEVDQAVREQQQRERELIAPLTGVLAAAPC